MVQLPLLFVQPAGIGQPIAAGVPSTNLYGSRIQWNQQALNVSLRQAANIKNALVEWGNQGGEMQLRYITNPLDSNGFTKILNLTSVGNAYIGKQKSGNFTVPRFEVNTDSTGQIAIAASTTALLGNSFLNRSTQTSSNSTITPTIRIQSVPNNVSVLRTDGIYVSASGANANVGLTATATDGTNFNSGIQGQAGGTGYQTGIGIFGSSGGANSKNYGVQGIATGASTSNNYGVYGSSTGATGWSPGYMVPPREEQV